MIDLQAQQEHANPRSVYYINRQAKSYLKLQNLIENDRDLFLGWQSKGVVLIVNDVNAVNEENLFSLDELNEVCPLLRNTIFALIDLESTCSCWEAGAAAKVVWRHCANPGLCYYGDESCGGYIIDLQEITKIDNENKSVLCTTAIYRIELGQYALPKSSVLIVKLAEAPSTPYAKNVITIPVLEEIYPGFTKRLQAAKDLGFTPKELAMFAKDTTYEIKSTIVEESSSVLPTMSTQ